MVEIIRIGDVLELVLTQIAGRQNGFLQAVVMDDWTRRAVATAIVCWERSCPEAFHTQPGEWPAGKVILEQSNLAPVAAISDLTKAVIELKGDSRRTVVMSILDHLDSLDAQSPVAALRTPETVP